jgi:hypothetical protein
VARVGCLALDSVQPVTCTACGRVHLINPRTGKVAGTEK